MCARLRDAVRGRGELRAVRTLADIADFLRRSTERTDVVVVPSVDVTRRDATGFVRETAKAFPDVALVAYCCAGFEHGSEIRALALAGVHHFFFAGEESRSVLRSTLASARRECASARVLSELAGVLDERLLPIVEESLRRPADVHTVADLANAIGLHRKTLYDQCVRSGLRGPADLITWVRLALVGYLLGRTGRTVESIADELDFASSSALRNLLRRHVGLTGREIRANGGLACVISALQKHLAERPRMHVV
ncbi:MAG TPA: AraC family transcriptional regulator [Gemmatimonadaceae bacterium]